MPDEIDRLTGQADGRDGRVVWEVRFNKARSEWIREIGVWIGVDIDNVFPFQIVNVTAIVEKAVEEQKAQIRHSRFWKR